MQTWDPWPRTWWNPSQHPKYYAPILAPHPSVWFSSLLPWEFFRQYISKAMWLLSSSLGTVVMLKTNDPLSFFQQLPKFMQVLSWTIFIFYGNIFILSNTASYLLAHSINPTWIPGYNVLWRLTSGWLYYFRPIQGIWQSLKPVYWSPSYQAMACTSLLAWGLLFEG